MDKVHETSCKSELKIHGNNVKIWDIIEMDGNCAREIHVTPICAMDIIHEVHLAGLYLYLG